MRFYILHKQLMYFIQTTFTTLLHKTRTRTEKLFNKQIMRIHLIYEIEYQMLHSSYLCSERDLCSSVKKTFFYRVLIEPCSCHLCFVRLCLYLYQYPWKANINANNVLRAREYDWIMHYEWTLSIVFLDYLSPHQAVSFFSRFKKHETWI